jgi:hypothetical protein
VAVEDTSTEDWGSIHTDLEEVMVEAYDPSDVGRMDVSMDASKLYFPFGC